MEVKIHRRRLRIKSLHRCLRILTSTILIAINLSGCETRPTVSTETEPEAVEEFEDSETPDSLPELSVQEHNRVAIGLLEQGKNGEATKHLERSALLAPNQKLAFMLLRQLKNDPVEYLGHEWFSYDVEPNETLSMIAERFLDESLLFVILARYNNIVDPSSIPVGRQIRIPGTRPEKIVSDPTPVPEPSALLAEADDAEKNRDYERAYELTLQAGEIDTENEVILSDKTRRRDLLIDDIAKTAYLREDEGRIDDAVLLWKKVLLIDANSPSALLNIKRLDHKTE